MRDGVRLYADVYLPNTPGPFPVILTRMPYDKQSDYGLMPALGRFWAQHRYAYVAQDVRGRYTSEGTFGRVDEVSDGYDTIDWVAKQAWCNGNIGVTGESYYGYTTWAAAVSQHPNLKSIAPVDITPDLYERRFLNGAFRLEAQGGWALGMDGRAQLAASGGSLDLTPPAGQPADTYDYDPADPVVYGMDLSIWERAVSIRDRSSIADRPDVLTYTTLPLSEALEITGPVTAALYAASTAPDTDFTAALVDVFPDDYAQSIQEGILRASFRESDRKPAPIEPGRVYRYDIDLWAASYVVQPGHRIRVEISNSNFPRFARNLNTDAAFGMSDEIAVATQTVYHNAKHPSHITLPVIPR
jgi:predicted acyl esterase